MLIAVINFITSTLGIIGFFCDIPVLIVIGGIMYTLETIAGLITGELRSIATTVISSIISISLSLLNGYNVFYGWCVGLCVESILLSLISLVFIKIASKMKKGI